MSASSHTTPVPPKKAGPEVPDCDWFSPAEPPFRLCGFPFFEKDGIYRRAPLEPEAPLPAGVEANVWGSSGGQVRFTAETSALWVRVRLKSPIPSSYNATPLLKGGFDLYASDGGGKSWHFCGVTRFDPRNECFEYKLLNMSHARRLSFLLNFPIQSRVEDVSVGLDRGAVPEPPPAFDDDRRILFYGGSIIHGYSATRPGMIMPNIISRRFNREVVNFGVNGSAKCEDETALTVRSIPRVRLFIVSPEGNCPTVEWYRGHLTSFLKLYREANPDTVIAVMSYMREGREYFDDEALALRQAKKQCGSGVVRAFREAGDDRIFFWDGEEFTSGQEDFLFEGWSAGDECTTDTQHKSDLGFWLMANGICRRIAALKEQGVL